MGRGPGVSVIVPCYRHAALLPRVLEALAGQETSLDFEVLVVESGGDEAARVVGERFPEVRVLSHGHRLFPGAARNRGAAAARGDCLAFVDADAVPERKWLETLYGRLDASDRIVMVSGTVALPAGAGAASRVLHWIEFSSFLPGLASGCREALSSSNLLVRKEDLLACGGFDESLEMAEDLMLSRRIGEAGGHTTIYRGICRGPSLEGRDLGKGLGPSAPPRLLERPVSSPGEGSRILAAAFPRSQPGASPVAASPYRRAGILQ